jgi:hypothetical protein
LIVADGCGVGKGSLVDAESEQMSIVVTHVGDDVGVHTEVDLSDLDEDFLFWYED